MGLLLGLPFKVDDGTYDIDLPAAQANAMMWRVNAANAMRPITKRTMVPGCDGESERS
jgi:hypothetical protein